MRTALGLRTRALLAAAVVVSVTPYVQGDALVAKDGNGIIRVTPYTLDSTYQNTAWTTAQQDAFWTRNTAILNSWGSNTSYGSTYFENEKSSYPKAMLSYLWGIANNNASSISSAKAFLVDNARYDTGNVGGADNTNLVDLYPSFTLKGQMTKYFWFGKLSGQTLGTTNGYLYLKYPAGSTGENVGWDNKTYLDRMQDAMSKWTNDSWTQPIVSTTTGGWTVANNGVAFPDPLTRPNQYYSTPGQGWTEAGWNSWVDVRNTDNLKAMREAAVYLFAQESNNPGNMARYKANLQQVTTTLYRTGQSEWDSENYWCWSIGPNLSVLDYANDPALKRNAKANLDFDMCAGALKYLHGGFGGPTKRDYGGGNVVWGSGSSHTLYQYFGSGGSWTDPSPDYSNAVHAMLSSYRPPQAALGLANKNWGSGHTGPVEMINTKPSYANWADPNSPQEISTPETWETLYFRNTYYLGTCVSKTGIGDVGPFKLLANNAARGVDYFVPYSAYRDADSSSSTYNAFAGTINTKRSTDQIAQYQNLALWLRPATEIQTWNHNNVPGSAPTISGFGFQAPTSATFERDDAHHVWFYKLADANTFLAVRLINVAFDSSAAGTGAYAAETYYRTLYTGTIADTSSRIGFALEVGETGQYADYNAFKTSVLSRPLDLTQLAAGTVSLANPDGSFLKMTYNSANDLPTVYRNSATPYDFTNPDNYALYRSINIKPTAALTGVADGQNLPTGHNITLTANAADSGQRGPMAMDWKTGKLSVLANGYLFEETVAADGTTSWSERVATAADYLGVVTRVEWYANGQLLGTDTDPSDGWSLPWTNPTPGTYVLQAKAVDNDTEVGWSTPLTITVGAVPEPATLGLLIAALPLLLRRRR